MNFYNFYSGLDRKDGDVNGPTEDKPPTSSPPCGNVEEKTICLTQTPDDTHGNVEEETDDEDQTWSNYLFSSNYGRTIISLISIVTLLTLSSLWYRSSNSKK